jgi:hypothetical protein
MTEQELRMLVRDAIARHSAATSAAPADQAREGRSTGNVRLHSSHSIFPVTAGSDGDGACIIEPAVGCNHCGYCKSLGH